MGSIKHVELEIPAHFIEALVSCPTDTTLKAEAFFHDNTPCVLDGERSPKSINIRVSGVSDSNLRLTVNEQTLACRVKASAGNMKDDVKDELKQEVKEENVGDSLIGSVETDFGDEYELSEEDVEPESIEDSYTVGVGDDEELMEVSRAVKDEIEEDCKVLTKKGFTPVPKKFSCPDFLCKRTFVDWDKLRDHFLVKKAHVKQSDFRELVDKVFEMKGEGAQNLLLECPACNDKLPFSSILTHLQSQHFTDPYYGQYRIQCIEVINKHSPDMANICSYCLKSFDDAKKKNRHVNYSCSRNPDRKEAYCCRFCVFQSFHKGKFDAHVATHIIKCETCGQKCDSKETLTAHMATHQEKEASKDENEGSAMETELDEMFANSMEDTNASNLSVAVSDEETDEEEDGDEKSSSVTYMTLEKGSKRGMPQLVDSLGYTYAARIGRKGAWRCTVRNKKTQCAAGVQEYNGVYKRSKSKHSCKPNPIQAKVCLIKSQVKEKSLSHRQIPAKTLVDEILSNFVDLDNVDFMPKPMQLVRLVNKYRQLTTDAPMEDESTDFKLLESRIPKGFLKQDIWKADRRHIILATDDQLKRLKKVKKWYLDIHAHVSPYPFSHLMSIHGYLTVRSKKLVPLCFVFMSGDTLIDFTLVMENLKELLLPDFTKPLSVTADFIVEAWGALRSVFDTDVKGCFYHFYQAVWRKIGALGYHQLYQDDPKFRNVCRLLMSLPLLPPKHIEPVFCNLSQAPHSQEAQALFTFFEETWMGDSWPPESWSVYQERVRSMDDVEGWVCKLKQDKEPKDFYDLVCQLEDNVMAQQAQMMSSPKVTQEKTNVELPKLWAEYSDSKRSARSLLEAGSRLVCPEFTV